ncbi:MAG: hypothetical protein CMO04_14130 [Thalassospira sp.]|uniref:hypothetical protein n=1 Tax=Thalassospira sp. TaxID=1912094 RepID=UPI000C4C7ADA|nr:hypothetical protein [Thalassospira sp.]MAL41011.1 hypothetical protein [Thalassospira sp.]
MNSVDSHPARRKGERNFSDPGRDWGPACHIVPGRRINEPNYKAGNSPVALLARSRSNFDLIAESSKEIADGPPPSDPYEAMAMAMIRTIGESVSVLKSIADVMPTLDRMLVGRDGESLHEEALQDKTGSASDKASEKARAEGKENALCWSSDMMVEIHNLCAQNRKSGQAHAKAIRRYDIDPEPDNDIFPPLRNFRND